MSYSNSPSNRQDKVFQYSYPHSYHYISDGSTIGGEESNFWPNSPRSECASPSNILHPKDSLNGTYLYPNGGCSLQSHQSPYRNTLTLETELGTPFVRVVKRRTTANKKERRRTQSINNAYHDLRSCIPNVPDDTKLSKIKTLRLATSYISYLTRALETDDTPGNFKAELGTLSKKSNKNYSSCCNLKSSSSNSSSFTPSIYDSPKSDSSGEMSNTRKAKGRTGWPQHVWALELKQEQAL
ncbi:heart- and neural crest derivatives-expressed protein 2-like [Anthonomus grandis grandis]|uniref:heart- and neural crest derivatives-expressed protein 2-like n=1 Tax=Anthonomus grandis grandis TaxID=2921223 RepID=UPI002166B5F0|nr:heart- and neural crest derivatives-expressed protein 2-like [Anthonomus grandis grandis]